MGLRARYLTPCRTRDERGFSRPGGPQKPGVLGRRLRPTPLPSTQTQTHRSFCLQLDPSIEVIRDVSNSGTLGWALQTLIPFFSPSTDSALPHPMPAVYSRLQLLKHFTQYNHRHLAHIPGQIFQC